MEFKELTEIIHNLVVSAAAITGGFWVLNRIYRERTDEAALEMTLTHSSWKLDGPPPDKYAVVFTVELANRGKTKIEAKRARTQEIGSGNWYIFDDRSEKLENACSLQIMQVDEGNVGAMQRLDWFEPQGLISEGRVEHNVLIDYQNPKKKDKARKEVVEFWMEPGEIYRLGVPVVLSKGVYLAKLTFVGADTWLGKLLARIGVTRASDGNFWSQIYGFSVHNIAEDLKG